MRKQQSEQMQQLRRRLSNKDAVFVTEYLKDFSARRAAEASGYAPEHGYKVLDRPEVMEAINTIIDQRMDDVGIDATWLLFELVDNHRIARHQGNINASNTALATIAKHVSVDAMAKQQVVLDVVSDTALMERLIRGRMRLGEKPEPDDGEVSFL